MFGIQYYQWKLTCASYQKARPRRKEAYLQLYPLSKITENGWNKLQSQDFYDKYVSNGSFVNFPYVMFHTSHYMQKDDGSFRDAELLSPILFLILQALGKELSDLYTDERPYNDSVYYVVQDRNLDYYTLAHNGADVICDMGWELVYRIDYEHVLTKEDFPPYPNWGENAKVIFVNNMAGKLYYSEEEKILYMAKSNQNNYFLHKKQKQLEWQPK